MHENGFIPCGDNEKKHLFNILRNPLSIFQLSKNNNKESNVYLNLEQVCKILKNGYFSQISLIFSQHSFSKRVFAFTVVIKYILTNLNNIKIELSVKQSIENDTTNHVIFGNERRQNILFCHISFECSCHGNRKLYGLEIVKFILHYHCISYIHFKGNLIYTISIKL